MDVGRQQSRRLIQLLTRRLQTGDGRKRRSRRGVTGVDQKIVEGYLVYQDRPSLDGAQNGWWKHGPLTTEVEE